MKPFLLLWICSQLISVSLKAQQDTTAFNVPLQMDDVVISAARKGWDVAGFIRRVQTDTTFYKAFRSLHVVAYTATNDIRMYNKKDEVIASLLSHTRQLRRNNCRSTQVIDEKVTGDFYKRNGSYRYFTAGLFAYLFFTKGSICGENDIVANTMQEREPGLMGKSEWQLKQLVFNPGGKIKGVPFIGNKASIFDPEIAKMYDFKLLSVDYAGEDCYLFQAVPKPEYKSEVVYNELSTWFRKSDYSIVARDYSLSYKAGVYDFDVRMKVRLQIVGNKLLPSRIEYDGNWHVMMQDRERSRFSATFAY